MCFRFTGSTLKEVGPNEVLIHYVDNVAKSHVHKILLFDELKTRYLNFATRLRFVDEIVSNFSKFFLFYNRRVPTQQTEPK